VVDILILVASSVLDGAKIFAKQQKINHYLSVEPF